ncbi:TPA: hypothetical protein ACH3X1_007580 [Trebouxia sp. C0004]
MAVKHCLHFVQVGPGREGKVSDPIRCQAFAHVQIRRATDTADFRAAAFLRAASFYKYSPDRSQYAARIHQRMKGDAEWAAIEAKVSGKDTDYKVMHDKLHSSKCMRPQPGSQRRTFP